MHDELVSQSKLIAVTLWTLSVLLIIAVWTLAAAGISDSVHRALFLTGVLTIACANVWQVRIYAQRLCALIRVSSGLQAPDAEVHVLSRERTL